MQLHNVSIRGVSVKEGTGIMKHPPHQKEVRYYEFQEVIKLIIDQVRILLQTKHSYQSVSISVPEGKVLTLSSTNPLASVQDVIMSEWSWMKTGVIPNHQPLVPCYAPSVKLYCGKCEHIYPFESIAAVTLSISNDGVSASQDFAFSYQCHGCSNEVVSFLVRRAGAKLTLCGRSPIEHVAVPTFIPKDVRKYYSSAEIAFNAGQWLPAIFMLRTLIEQHMRLSVKEEAKVTGDVLCAKYNDTIDKTIRGSCQSLTPVYVVLSEAIHAAKDDPDIFQKQRDCVLAHFEFVDAFNRRAVRLGSSE